MSVNKKKKQYIGVAVGFFFLLGAFVVPPPVEMPLSAWYVAGVAFLMATWWITEAVPLPATAMLPLVLFPMLAIMPVREAASSYADPIIFLFLGGFIIGTGMQRWSLHKRIGLRAIAWIGTTPRMLIGGFLFATALLSMWVSNSASAIMMLPVAISVLTLFDGLPTSDDISHRNLSMSLLLATAYGASIGGLGTLIGTPPNALLAAYMAREHGVQIGFAQWMLFGVPLALVMLLGVWAILCSIYPVAIQNNANASDAIAREIHALGLISKAEVRVACVFGLTACAWVTSPLFSGLMPGLNDTTIAIAGAIALFLIPSGMPESSRLLDWKDLKSLPWSVLILFGGGLSLADAISGSGLAAWLGVAMSMMRDWPILMIIAAATLFMIFFTEITSNTASAATFIPVGGAVGIGIGLDPLALAVPLALAASCAFMLPVATPPNAIIFSSERVPITQMAFAGFWCNLLSSIVIVLFTHAFVGPLFGK